VKKNEVKKVTEIKKLRLSRETLRALTSSDNQKVVGGVETVETDDCNGGTSPWTQCTAT
jgi:hypothetical protein